LSSGRFGGLPLMARELSKLVGTMYDAEPRRRPEEPGPQADINKADINKAVINKTDSQKVENHKVESHKAGSHKADSTGGPSSAPSSSTTRSPSPGRAPKPANPRTEPMQATADTTQSTAALFPTSNQDKAAELVNRYTAWAAAAGVIPVPIVDAVAIGGVQLKMLREIAAIYGVEFSENRGKSIVAALVGALGSAGAAPVAAMGVTSALKFIPVIGTVLASVTMPAFSAAATYAIGKVFIRHFESGGTLLDLHPQDYREFLREQAKSKAGKDAAPAPAPARAAKAAAS
jgi:uncharacterized protein (DUF697 family)